MDISQAQQKPSSSGQMSADAQAPPLPQMLPDEMEFVDDDELTYIPPSVDPSLSVVSSPQRQKVNKHVQKLQVKFIKILLKYSQKI